MSNTGKKARKLILQSFRKLQLKGWTVQVDGSRIMGKTWKRGVLKRLRFIFGVCRQGGKVELCDSPVSDTILPLMLQKIEILNNIELLKDVMKTIFNAECEGPATIVYRSWARLQIQALYNHLDETNEIEYYPFQTL